MTSNDQLVVVCRLPGSWEVFWYSREGAPLYQVEISNANLPAKPVRGTTAGARRTCFPTCRRRSFTWSFPPTGTPGTPAAAASAAMDAVTTRAYKLDLRTQQYDSRGRRVPGESPAPDQDGPEDDRDPLTAERPPRA